MVDYTLLCTVNNLSTIYKICCLFPSLALSTIAVTLINKNCAHYSRVSGRLFPGQCRALLVAGSENLIV
jgi:hypothetical protein